MTRWETLVQQTSQALRTRQFGTLVFARLIWQSDTLLEQVPPKLARLLETLATWVQQPPENLHLMRSADGTDSTLVVEFRPSATAIISHIRTCTPPLPLGQSSEGMSATALLHTRSLGLDLFLLGTQGALYLDGTQADWPDEPLAIPDLPVGHPIRVQIEQVWR